MNTSFYKCCVVPMCKNTSINTPQKLFIYVPKSAKIRRKWLTLARRCPTSLSTTSTSYFCEDHFDLQNDMENYVEYTTMGAVSRIRMRPGCLPTKFDCQLTRSNSSANICRPVAAKRQKFSLLNDCDEFIRAVVFQQTDKVPNQEEDPLDDQQQKIIEKTAQVYNTTKRRSTTTQTGIKSRTKQTSPIKCSNPSVSNSSEPLHIELVTVKEEKLIENVSTENQEIDVYNPLLIKEENIKIEQKLNRELDIKEEIEKEFHTELIIKEEMVADAVKEEKLVENLPTEHHEIYVYNPLLIKEENIETEEKEN
ncbi:uncharacterized protein LOC123299008 [Chrysoperla carnea]|uniref:uncharacterized protein LOC123299008 n=1 Tax=Chrysoperla carnea TaxID=189513 RepID=UPI001D079335|nr:uncharacterized protein LOC123299008 [Chrysoperla carnea]